MEIIKGERVFLQSLKLNNVYDMRDWAKYENSLFEDYNFPDLDDFEVRRWFDIKTSQKDYKCFSILNEQRKTIGFISIKEIKKILKIASLGISFDADYINKGYGTDAIKTLLKYYFHNMKMRIMYLDVAKHNARAIRCYTKCGFKMIKKYTLKIEDIDIRYDDVKKEKDSFIFKNDYLYGYYYKMKLTKNDYSKLFLDKIQYNLGKQFFSN